MKRIIMDLTEEQQAALKPIMDKIESMATTGKKGMVVAQVWPGHIEAAILTYPEAQKFKHFAVGVDFEA